MDALEKVVRSRDRHDCAAKYQRPETGCVLPELKAVEDALSTSWATESATTRRRIEGVHFATISPRDEATFRDRSAWTNARSPRLPDTAQRLLMLRRL